MCPSEMASPVVQAFDELLLMKRGGRIIFFGETGYRSQNLIDYFQVLPAAACCSLCSPAYVGISSMGMATGSY